ncbi:MAG: tripartite tricarboxylate transporter substrate binding protein [Lachnospiraceae bacterium]|nr:tripartite tricarboxylate transporter substrate binding protein [Lachnospiraceae bacterium]
MKKWLAYALSVLLLLSLTSCGQNGESTQSPSIPSSAEGTTAPVTTKAVDFPTKAITIIVPTNAGGSYDIFARTCADAVDLGKPVTVTNMSGGGGGIATMEVYHSPADGYTLLVSSPESIATCCVTGIYEPDIYQKMIPVRSLATNPYVLLTSKDSGFKSLEEVVEYAKAHPGELTIAGASSMTYTQLSVTDMFNQLGIEVEYVPYDGGASVRTAIMGGHESLAVLGAGEALTAVESGDVVLLCALADERISFYPDTPAIKELGDYNVNIGLHMALYATTGTPQEIMDILGDAFSKAADNAELKDKFLSMYYIPANISSEEGVKLTMDVYDKVSAAYEKLSK